MIFFIVLFVAMEPFFLQHFLYCTGMEKNVLGEVPGMLYTLSSLYFLWRAELEDIKIFGPTYLPDYLPDLRVQQSRSSFYFLER
jgi:hypothetical protein